MLHLEIRKIDPNGPYGAYRVDHNPNVPDEYSVLFDENDAWENLDFGKTPYLYSLIQMGNEKWVIRVGVQNDIGGTAGPREVGVLFSKNDNILGIVIALFNAAPGQGYLSEFSTAVSNGLTESQLADGLAASSVFTGNILGEKLTKAAKITELMSHFGLVADGVPGSAASIAEAYFNNRIDSNAGYGVIATEATYYLLGNPLLNNEVDREFLPTSLLFKLKVVVADNYSASNSPTDLATLQAILAGITLRVGTDNSDTIEGSLSGGVIEGRFGGDHIILEIDKNARDILLLNNVHDSQILDISNDGFIRISDDGNNLFFDAAGEFSTSAADTGDDIDASNSFFDVVTNFSTGAADTGDRIDVSSFNFTGTQSGLLDVSARVSIDTDLTHVPDLFHDEIAGDRGLAFLKYFETTYVFADDNNDGDFTAADDLFLALVGVDDLINANFIYFPGDIGNNVSEPAITAEQLNAILCIYVGFFDAAPGKSNLTPLVDAVSAGVSIAQLADKLAASTLFSTGILAGAVTIDQQAAILTSHFGLTEDGDPSSPGSQMVSFFTDAIESGMSIGFAVYQAVQFLKSVDTGVDSAYVYSSILLQNKALVSEVYSENYSSDDLSILQSVLVGIVGDKLMTRDDAVEYLGLAKSADAIASDFMIVEGGFVDEFSIDVTGVSQDTIISNDFMSI